ncbi:hypothetical protein WJX73_005302 [Symbiochloris irregularis]|uniref:3'-phosphate/5'-hydroxy nucleic acid ligase n=1 Tax=Symbiochloris irregularis TaxID=706552 RepID=A0AAW1PBR4_9CHLO
MSQKLWNFAFRRTRRQAATFAVAQGAQENLSESLPVVIETANVPVYLFAPKEEVEPEAIQQLIKLAESPMPVGFVSAMPDVHLGKGVTIGTVFASEAYIAPHAVGVDIGCGMCAVPVDGLFKDQIERKSLVQIQNLIKKYIPTGRHEHKNPLQQAKETIADISDESNIPSSWLEEALHDKKVANQLGTLGGGNHFIEVVYDEATEQVWIMLHSGSRNIGNKSAMHHDGIAKDWLAREGLDTPTGLNYMPIASDEGKRYLQDMEWCQRYAFHNRRFMLDLVAGAVEKVTKRTPDTSRVVNIHHNYCQCERCSWTDPTTGQQMEKSLWVTRKGATSAQHGQLGLIPGNMGVGSFLTRGKGNSASWNSCSHGAGRAMSRKKAMANIKQEDFVAQMAGIICDTDAKVRDEAPNAYKDLTKVMANQKDLVDVELRLLPLINVKGF